MAKTVLAARDEAERDADMTPRERRRTGWREFREAYPRVVTTMAFGAAVLLLLDGWVLYKRVQYTGQVERLRGEMTVTDRRRADALLAATANRAQLVIALVRHDARLDQDLNLAVSLGEGRLYLQRGGDRLREMRVRVGPQREIGAPPDTVRLAPPLGRFVVARVVDGSFRWEVPSWVYEQRGLHVPAERAVAGALGPVAVLLNGGQVIYGDPATGPLQDADYILPGSVRADATDLQAIVASVEPGMPVYFH